jgi:hypothetical protein
MGQSDVPKSEILKFNFSFLIWSQSDVPKSEILNFKK